MKIKASENENTQAIIQELELKGYRVWKIYNGGVPGCVRDGEIVFRKKEDKYKGIPDLLAIHPKKKLLLFCEVKGTGGKPSPEQIDFQIMADNCTTRAIITDTSDVKL